MTLLLPYDGQEVIKPYHETPEEIQASDKNFFVDNPTRKHRLRKANLIELKDCFTKGNEHHEELVIVVRRYSPGAFARRAFLIWETEGAEFRDALCSADDEVLGRALWALYDMYNSRGYALHDQAIDLVVKVFDDLKRFPLRG
jgi:hypothetical protein